MHSSPDNSGDPLGNKKGIGTILILGLLLLFATCTIAVKAVSPTTVLLGRAADFSVLAGSGITNTGSTTITGDIGTYPTTTESGFGSVTFLHGTNHVGDAVTQDAKVDLLTAYIDMTGRTPDSTVPTELGGTTQTPGVYASDTFGITGPFTLDGVGDPNAVFIFQAGSTLITASGSVVSLINGAHASNVFWQVSSSATIDTNSIFVGNILAHDSITVNTGAAVDGRVLALNGAVTLDNNTIKTQYNVTFAQSGLDGTVPSGTVLTVNGSSIQYSSLQYSVWVNSGDMLVYSYNTSVSSSTAGKQFVLGTVSPLSPLVGISSAQTVTGSYQTQFYLTMATNFAPTSPVSGWCDTGSVIAISATLLQ